MGSIVDTKGPVRVAIDRGGTFTDVVVFFRDGSEKVLKLLSNDPGNYNDVTIEALRRILEEVDGRKIPKGVPLCLDSIESLRMGTTVATNALLERQGEKTVLLITRGFKDLLKIGNQSRPELFNLCVRRPELLYSKVIEVNERVTLHDSTSYRRGDDDDANNGAVTADGVVTGLSGERVRIVEPLDLTAAQEALRHVYAEGIRSVAICLLHAYTFPDHEQALAAVAHEIGFSQVSVSSQLSPAIRMLPRAHSTVTDAYLTPPFRSYIKGFEDGVSSQSLSSFHWRIMQSDGGLAHPSQVSGLRTLLSGPAGGVIGYARTAYDGTSPVVGFDMGGTSTDVSRYDGQLEHVFETVTAGIPVQVPQLDINTVAAGGGSILTWQKGGIMNVGPSSAGSHPGPACYRHGGPATVTDANLVLGRILPSSFPAIFGPGQDQPLDVEASFRALSTLTESINADRKSDFSVHDIALGFITVANESMCRPIRALTEAKGHKMVSHVLAAFGGAGGQHACGIAETLGIRRVLIHKYSSVLSAYGMALADTVEEARRPLAQPLNDSSMQQVKRIFAELREKTHSVLQDADSAGHNSSIDVEYFLNLRYDGSDTSLMIAKPADHGDAFARAFAERHRQEFGFTPTDRDVLIDDVRVRSTARSGATTGLAAPNMDRELKHAKVSSLDAPQSKQTAQVFFKGHGMVSVPLYRLADLEKGRRVPGPAMLIDDTQTIVVSAEFTATSLSSTLVLDKNEDTSVDKAESSSDNAIDPINLSVFANRFMGIAEQMGHTLQKTSVSTNIKERLDFSCAVFAADGGLVCNAPHVPAMLGSMAFSVRWQINNWGADNIRPGDVFLSNSPNAGGAHLPDLTVITPVFNEAGTDLLFWTASRGHHADVGGIVPGSMPADSVELWQEGAIIEAVKVVENGVFRDDRVIKVMLHDPAQYPGCEGARCIQDNITDIKAAIAANHKGSNLIDALIADYGLATVRLYMAAVQDASASAVRETLKSIADARGRTSFEAEDFMDDGSRIHLSINIDPATGDATFDFTGTSPQAYGNWNAPKSVVNSATIFVLRCLVDAEVPLNQGLLLPIRIIIPDDSFLNPGPDAAVCGGNGLTSQRLCDTILKTLEVCAASQGDMNNFTFGLEGSGAAGFGYYETIAGGHGAGPYWQGEDGVHVNMTNTRITDPEILERRYPVLLRNYSLRPGSGGAGRFRGGHGVVRELEFLVDMHAGILSERRCFQPYGMAGGQPGARGENLWIRSGGASGKVSYVNVGSKASIRVKAGDRLRISTPGGGGYGPPEEADQSDHTNNANGIATNGTSTAKTNGALRANGSLYARMCIEESAIN
ncbi:hydantoinase B/oxoprolinase [Niveomyces insectorum RCEF 264]|uniref:Hydantoinase B/oxoprolinase n=1 Tax=Niveomyces insectorum RCEF 264 TaxID=1081102 RepID=A0A167T9D0_9HYPO|nr:hydantoinase B/oxoprolinase [Niveomyces insectorum RCEF 264]